LDVHDGDHLFDEAVSTDLSASVKLDVRSLAAPFAASLNGKFTGLDIFSVM